MLRIGNAFRFAQVHTALLLGAATLQCCGGGDVASPKSPKSAEDVFKVSQFVALPDNYTVARSTGELLAVNCADATCPYGAWLCDRLVEAGKTLLDWETDIAMYPAASLRAGGLPEGKVTKGRLAALHGAADLFVQVRLWGDAIERVLLEMLRRHGEEGGKDGCFLQTGGLRYKAFWNELRRAWDLDVVEVWREGAWQLLDPEAQYNLITGRSLVVAGACGFPELAEQPSSGVLHGSQTRVLLFQMLEKMKTISPPVHRLDRSCLYTASCSWSKTIGAALDDFHSNESVCRTRTCSYGIFMAEALLQHGRRAGKRSQIVLFNAGSIQNNLEAGNVSWEDFAQVHPFGEMFAYAELPASAVRRVLVTMLNTKGLTSTSVDFMQMAGLRFYAEWDPLLRGWDLGTTQVRTEEDKWLSIDMRSDATFSVIMNRFVMRGGDGFYFLEPYPFEVAGSARSVMIRQFLAEMSVQPPEVDERHCFSTNCSWLPVLATTEERLDGDAASCGGDTCSLGVLLCEALLQLGQEMNRSTQAVLLRAGVFRGSIPPGDVTYSVLAEVLDEGEAAAQTWLTGLEIRRILSRMMAKHGPPGAGGSKDFMQLAGLRLRAEYSGASQSWRVLDVEVRNGSRWEPLDLGAKYWVVLEERLFSTEEEERLLGREEEGSRAPEFQFLPGRWKESLGVMRTQLALHLQQGASSGPLRAPRDDDRHCLTPPSCRYPERGEQPMAKLHRLLGALGTGPTLVALLAALLLSAGLAALACGRHGGRAAAAAGGAGAGAASDEAALIAEKGC